MQGIEDHSYLDRFEAELWHELQGQKHSLFGDLEKRLPPSSSPLKNRKEPDMTAPESSKETTMMMDEFGDISTGDNEQTFWMEDLSLTESEALGVNHDRSVGIIGSLFFSLILKEKS
jgi:hypothetical protein